MLKHINRKLVVYISICLFLVSFKGDGKLSAGKYSSRLQLVVHFIFSDEIKKNKKSQKLPTVTSQ